MRKKSSLLFMIGLSVMLLLSACGDKQKVGGAEEEGQETRTFKFTHETPETHVFQSTAEKFGEELEERSNGRFKLEIFPAAQLGAEKDMVQQMQNGAVEFGFITNAYMSTRQESLNSWFMPFVFEDLEAAAKARTTESAKMMLKELESQQLVGLDFMFAGNRHVLMKDKPFLKISDIEGKKIRALGAQSSQDFWKGLGAGPTPMPLSEVYTSIQTGVIEGIDIDLDALVSQKYYESAKELTLTNHITFPTLMMMSKSVFDDLSEEDQTIVIESAKSAVEWGIEKAISNETTHLKTLEDHGVNIHEIEMSSELEKVRDDVQGKYSDMNETIKQFLEENK